ncbi:hypothetical protein FB451DRAFT_1360472 [Mycena latifolia]|nr:hypothetical protein FB451DRAFT_1360472 [Mycena latifolia]
MIVLGTSRRVNNYDSFLSSCLHRGFISHCTSGSPAGTIIAFSTIPLLKQQDRTSMKYSTMGYLNILDPAHVGWDPYCLVSRWPELHRPWRAVLLPPSNSVPVERDEGHIFLEAAQDDPCLRHGYWLPVARAIAVTVYGVYEGRAGRAHGPRARSRRAMRARNAKRSGEVGYGHGDWRSCRRACSCVLLNSWVKEEGVAAGEPQSASAWLHASLRTADWLESENRHGWPEESIGGGLRPRGTSAEGPRPTRTWLAAVELRAAARRKKCGEESRGKAQGRRVAPGELLCGGQTGDGRRMVVGTGRPAVASSRRAETWRQENFRGADGLETRRKDGDRHGAGAECAEQWRNAWAVSVPVSWRMRGTGARPGLWRGGAGIQLNGSISARGLLVGAVRITRRDAWDDQRTRRRTNAHEPSWCDNCIFRRHFVGLIPRLTNASQSQWEVADLCPQLATVASHTRLRQAGEHHSPSARDPLDATVKVQLKTRDVQAGNGGSSGKSPETVEYAADSAHPATCILSVPVKLRSTPMCLRSILTALCDVGTSQHFQQVENLTVPP